MIVLLHKKYILYIYIYCKLPCFKKAIAFWTLHAKCVHLINQTCQLFLLVQTYNVIKLLVNSIQNVISQLTPQTFPEEQQERLDHTG
jgi:hypothetical protein